MSMANYTDFIALIETSIKKNWDIDALTDFEGATYRYNDVARIIEKLHIYLEYAGVQPGDRVALYGRNSSHWAITMLGILTYGAVAVPILHEFSGEQAHNIVNHSGARLLFSGNQVYVRLNPEAMPEVQGIFLLDDFTLPVSRNQALAEAAENINAFYGRKYPKYFRKEHVSYRPQPDGEALALINYTSGTTGQSKGVMIPYRSLWSNAVCAQEKIPSVFQPGNRIVAILPAAHMYGLMFEFLAGFLAGMHTHYLTRVPSPRVIVKAFGDVKPHLAICVPLVVEKLLRKGVMPKLETPMMKAAMYLPYARKKILERVRQQLVGAFGGNIKEVVMGGAAFAPELEDFLHETGFPYTIGYGTTETGPLVTYESAAAFRPHSCGKAAPRMEIRIDSQNPTLEVGEILVKGANVMLGYYRNPEATAEAIDQGGWYHTGDLGLLDEEGNLFIRGRSKNMLLTSNGQNVYPEEVEARMNALPLVSECVMVQKDGAFYMLVHPDQEAVDSQGLNRKAVEDLMEQNRRTLNAQSNKYEQIKGIRIYDKEFEKTPKKSIKRYLYVNALDNADN